jgi:hypothetical protein
MDRESEFRGETFKKTSHEAIQKGRNEEWRSGNDECPLPEESLGRNPMLPWSVRQFLGDSDGFFKKIGIKPNKRSDWQMRRLWTNRTHWKAAKGSEKQNFNYCAKEGNGWIEKGFTDELERAKNKQEKEEYWTTRIRHAQEMSAEEFAIERILSDKNVEIWGKPGIGKSKWAHKTPVAGTTLMKM